MNGGTRKVKTDRGDYRGYYANVRDAIEKNAPLDVARSKRCAPCALSCSRTRAAAKAAESAGPKRRSKPLLSWRHPDRSRFAGGEL